MKLNISPNVYIFLLTLLSTIKNSQQQEPNQEKVVLVTEIIRHGARAPADISSIFPWAKQFEIGELTPVGKRQHYILGKEVQARYKALFEEEPFFNKHFFVRSTPFNRTIESAYSHMQGILEDRDMFTVPFKVSTDERMMPPMDLKGYNVNEKIKWDSALP